MLLLLLLIISLLILSLFRFSVYEFASIVAEKTHSVCLNNLPSNANSIAELKALVCAHNFSNLHESKLYISSGLIHLFVVSGAHFVLIEKILCKANFSRLLIFSILIVYGLACDLNAPVVRCLVAYSLNYYLHKKHIHWPAHFKLLVIGSLTLSFNYNWISSLSLQMSWIAAFLVIIGERYLKEYSLFFRQTLFFLALLPTIIFFQIPNPITILVNLFLAPLLELVLFPLGLLVLFVNFLSPIFDFLILLFKSVLQNLELDFQIQTSELPASLIIFNWCLIFCLHWVIHIFHINKKRKAS